MTYKLSEGPQDLWNRLGFWAGTVLTGLIWGAWHIQVFTKGPLYSLGFLVTTIALSFIMAFLIRGQTVGALWIAGSVRASFDIFGYLRGPGSDPGLAEQWVQAAVVGAIAVVVMLLIRRPSPRRADDAFHKGGTPHEWLPSN